MELSNLNNPPKNHDHAHSCVDVDSVSVDHAYKLILGHFQAKKIIELPLIELADLVLAKDIFSSFDFPQFNSSAMDGYALKSSDTHGASLSAPNYLTVIDDIHAGHKSKSEVVQGTTVRITTGAPIPKGADCIIPFENTDEVTVAATGYGLFSIALGTIDDIGLPSRYTLYQNYPNPFNPVTVIQYDLPEFSKVKLTIYDLAGRQVRSLTNETQAPGLKTIVWDAKDDLGNKMGAGVYIYQIKTDNYIDSKKMILVK